MSGFPCFLLEAANQQTSMLTTLIPFALIGVVFYFLILRPAKKRQQTTDNMLKELKKGDQVVTASGIYGVIAGVKDKTFVLTIAENVKVEMLKSAVTALQAPPEENK